MQGPAAGRSLKDKHGEEFLLTDVSHSDFSELYREYTHYFRPRVNFEPEAFACSNPGFLCSRLERGGETVGIFSGYALPFDGYAMHLSVIKPSFRRRGLYDAYLDALVLTCRSAGYKRIVSEHSNTNNPIIIAKLRKNFYITNQQLNPYYGSELQLTCFLDQGMEEAFKFRCGDLSLTELTAGRFPHEVRAFHQHFGALCT